MAVVMQMRWDGVTPEQYDETCDIVQWERDAPPGGIFHVAWFEDGALRVLDVWETPDQFQAFVETRSPPAPTRSACKASPRSRSRPPTGSSTSQRGRPAPNRTRWRVRPRHWVTTR